MKKKTALACFVVACAGARVACAGLLYEPSCYVAQESLALNLDGIRNVGLVSYRGADNNIIHAIFVNSEDRWDLARFLAPAPRDVSPYTVVHAATTVIFR